MIAVTFALPAESADFIRLLRHRKHRNRDGISIVSGQIDHHSIELFHTGVGETVSRNRLARFLRNREFDLLISTGFAGSLTNELAPGDLILAKDFSTAPLANLRNTIAQWTIHLTELYTVSAMISSAEDRQRIATDTGAAAVDMETKFIARACAERALLLLSLRVITDSPSHPFPAPPEILFNLTKQKTDFSAFARFFVSHPNRLPKLIRFARMVHRARKTLAHALVDLIRNLPS